MTVNVHPSFSASREGHLPVVDYLIDMGAIVSTSDRVGKTALHFASENGHKEIVKCLIQRLPRMLLFDESSKGTSLHLAARNGHAGVVDVFLELTTHSNNYRTPCKSNDPLESSSLDETPYEWSINILAQSPVEGRTPLHEAVIGGHTNIVRALVKWIKEQKKHLPSSGLSPNTSPSPYPAPPISPRTPQAPFTSSGSLVRTPTQSTFPNLLDVMTEMGRTPLQEATRLGHMDMIDILQEGGADINAVMRPSLDRTANADLTALVQAAMTNDPQMVRFLLQHGATDARLKALTRVLRIPYDDVAGLLLCYNGTITVDSGNIELRKRAGKESTTSPLLISVNWASKKLPYITSSWLDLVLIESPKPKAEFYGISQLNVSDNKLSELPIAVFQLRNILRLDISRNSISSLPISADWECDSLNHLDASHNHLTSLPKVLFMLAELKELHCTSNDIRDLPLEVWLAPKLKKLLLQKNHLESFPSPFLSHDSGFGTWETTPSDAVLHNSFSVADLSYMAVPLSPPSVSDLPLRKGSFHVLHRNRLQTSPVQAMHNVLSERRVSLPPANNLLRSRLRELFDTTAVDEDPFDDYEISEVTEASNKEGKVLFQLETLDLSHNHLTSLPQGLCCLAPKLLKLHLHHNKLTSLGTITNFSADLELLDVCNNELTTTIACARPREAIRNMTCAQKLLQLSNSTQESMTPTRCSHRNHRVLRRLGYLKLAHNKLVDVQLFRTTELGQISDLTSSIDESRFSRRSKTSIDMSMIQKDLNRSSLVPRTKESISSTEDGSSEEKKSSSVEVLYCLYPQLSTLDLGHNK